MLDIPFIAFWVLLFVGREQLGRNGILIAISVLLVIYLVFRFTAIPPSLFATAQAILDIVLVLIVFKGDVKFGR